MNIMRRCANGPLASRGENQFNWTGALRKVEVLQHSSDDNFFKKRKESRLHLDMKC